ncbi:MAG: nucleoside diphosphate kinase regulator [Gammaproteobacteria bacterium]|nr:nucleoside diphosphate kinase regulator [Gammaproteobacteria bacterium]
MATRFQDQTKRPKPNVIIDAGQYERLAGLARDAAKSVPSVAEQLLEEIERADVLPSEQMPNDVVTIGSDVTFTDNATGRTRTVQIAYPAQADIEQHRVSVLTPIGAALIGLSVGQSIDWEMNDGSIRRLTVVAVSRESAG